MNISQEIRSTLISSGDRMSVAEITDAIGALADKSFVAAICVQHFKKGVFGRAMEDGRLVYWMANATAAPGNIDQAEEPVADSAPVAHPEAFATTAIPSKVEECSRNSPTVVQAKEPIGKLQTTPKKQAALSNAIADLTRSDAELQAERIERTERSSHSIARMLTHLLSDAIDAGLDHEVLRRISTAQMAVQDVHGYLVHLR